MNPKFHSLTIKDVRKETKDAVSISFEMPTELIQDFQFSAGQYLTLKTLIDKEFEDPIRFVLHQMKTNGVLRLRKLKMENSRDLQIIP